MSICQLTALEELWLHDNELEALPSMMGKLKQLRTLTLSHNQLSMLPEGYSGMGGCASLAELWLKGNPLKRLPPELANLSTLRVLLLP
jgi:Leucine-rich repeat (LRR) protein